MNMAQMLTMEDYDKHVDAGSSSGSPSRDPMIKVFRDERQSRANRRAAFLAEQDAKYAAWCAANGVEDRVVGVDADTGVKTVVRGQPCIAAPSRFCDVRNVLGAMEFEQNRAETNAKQKAWAKKSYENRRRMERILRKRGVKSAAMRHRKREQ